MHITEYIGGALNPSAQGTTVSDSTFKRGYAVGYSRPGVRTHRVLGVLDGIKKVFLRSIRVP